VLAIELDERRRPGGADGPDRDGGQDAPDEEERDRLGKHERDRTERRRSDTQREDRTPADAVGESRERDEHRDQRDRVDRENGRHHEGRRREVDAVELVERRRMLLPIIATKSTKPTSTTGRFTRTP